MYVYDMYLWDIYECDRQVHDMTIDEVPLAVTINSGQHKEINMKTDKQRLLLKWERKKKNIDRNKYGLQI